MFFPKAAILDQPRDTQQEHQAVLIASPTALHAQQTEHYLRSNCHVFCEKPLATDGDTAQRLARLAEEKHRVLRVGYVRRYHEASQTLKTMIANQRYGPLERIVVQAGHQAAGLPASMMNPQLAGGGVTIDFGVHVLDSLRFWVNAPLEIVRYEDNAAGGIESDAIIELGSSVGGQSVSLFAQLSRTIDLGYVALAVFRDAIVRYEFDTGYTLHVLPRQQSATEPTPFARLEQVAPPTDVYTYFARQWQDFEASINGQPSPLTDIDSAVEVTRLVATAYAQRQPLRFDYEQLFSLPL